MFTDSADILLFLVEPNAKTWLTQNTYVKETASIESSVYLTGTLK